MSNRDSLGDLYTTNNELNANVTLTIGTNAFSVNTTSLRMNDGSANYFFVNSSIVILSNNTVSSTINATNFTGTANNALYLGSTIATGYQTTAGLSANVATLGYQTTAGLASNVATLTANNSTYLGGTIASSYQTTAGLAANVVKLDANNAAYLGGNLPSTYQTTAGLSANVAALTSNNASYLGGVAAASYATTTGSVSFNGSVSDNKGNLRTIPPNAQSTYTLVANDVGKYISLSVGGATVPSSIFSAGDAISIFNNSSASQTISSGAGVTMYLAGTATTGNRTLSQYGIATVLCVGTNIFVITGSGLT